MENIRNMPKLDCPFEREVINGNYVCVPKIKDEYRWVFTQEALAVDKLHGTNVSVVVENTKIKYIFNRTTYIEIFTKGTKRFVNGIYNSIERGYLSEFVNGQYYGELIGEGINSNPYKIDGQLWVPFYYLQKNYYYKFWDNFVKEVEGKSDEEIFNATSDLFKNLWSLYKRARKIGDAKLVNADTHFKNSAAAEGIVFYYKPTLGANFDIMKDQPGIVCKIRRDMFSWYKGDRHNDEEEKVDGTI